MNNKVDYSSWRLEEEAKNKAHFENAHKIAVHDALVAALADMLELREATMQSRIIPDKPELAVVDHARSALALAKKD